MNAHFSLGTLCMCRLAEQYKESLSSKEKIQKGIEVKKEHLSSLQPGLNAIMQVTYLFVTHTHVTFQA